MKAIIAVNRTTFSTANARIRNSRTSISGCRTRSSASTNPMSSSTPAAMDPIVVAFSQPQTWVCWRPKTSSPTPPEMSTRPVTSSRPGRFWVTGRAMNVSTSAMMATGTLTQKMARQVHSLR